MPPPPGKFGRSHVTPKLLSSKRGHQRHYWDDAHWRMRYLMRRTHAPMWVIYPIGFATWLGMIAVVEIFLGHFPWYGWAALGFIVSMFLYNLTKWITDDVMDRRWKEWAIWVDANNARMLDHMEALRQRRHTSIEERAKAGGLPPPPVDYRLFHGATLPPAQDAEADRYV